MENINLWKLQQSVLLYYPGIRRILLIMSHSFHLRLASHERTSGSSEEFRISLKNEHAENVNQGKRDFNVSGWEGDKTQGFRLSQSEASQELSGKPRLRETSIYEHWRRNCDDVNTHQDPSSSRCSPPEVA